MQNKLAAFNHPSFTRQPQGQSLASRVIDGTKANVKKEPKKSSYYFPSSFYASVRQPNNARS